MMVMMMVASRKGISLGNATRTLLMAPACVTASVLSMISTWAAHRSPRLTPARAAPSALPFRTILTTPIVAADPLATPRPGSTRPIRSRASRLARLSDGHKQSLTLRRNANSLHDSSRSSLMTPGAFTQRLLWIEWSRLKSLACSRNTLTEIFAITCRLNRGDLFRNRRQLAQQDPLP